jgi:asparagine synthase (glutamine-hydrolysing)
MTTNLKSLLKWEDKNSMRFSIESRVPYLDYRLVEFAFSLPYYFKIKNFETKHIFRKTIKNYVPKKIIERKDKIGFATPEKDWLKTREFDTFVKKIIYSNSFVSRTIWDYKKIQKIYQKKNKQYYTNIWKIINTELWFRTFIDKNSF